MEEKGVQKGIIHLLLHHFICVCADNILYMVYMTDRICRNKVFVP